MAYIGNTVQNQGFTPAIDYFNGNGVTVTFTLSRPIASVAQLIVAIDNVIQNPSTAFSVSGNSITFTSAPLSGTNNIWVEYTSLITTYNAISQDPSVIGDISATGGYLAEGDFGNTFIDGTIVDYVTGNARITTGPADAMTFYNGGTNARNPLMTLGATGNVGVGTISPGSKLAILESTNGNSIFNLRNTSAGSSATSILALGNDGALNGAYLVLNSSTNTAGGGGNSLNITNGFNAGMTFGTNGTERMRIDSGGRVTMPFQPAFSAFGAGSQSLSGAAAFQILQLGAQSTLGSRPTGYNTGTYTFTAPVAGTYAFFAKITQTSTTTGPAVNVFVNGVSVGSEVAINYATSFVSTSGFLIIQLAANDAVTARVINYNSVSVTMDTTRCSFSGWLLG